MRAGEQGVASNMKPDAMAAAPDGDALYRKIVWRIVPYAFLCYIFNYLDRVNVGFAKLQMLGDLEFSESAYGLGAGIFFLGYIACGVPANLMLQRIGARRWLACIMMLWGAFSTALLFVRSETDFYLLRFLTGCAEAGFFPGMLLYLNNWFPAAQRGRVLALFMAAIPVSGVLGGPFSGWILGHFAQGQHGLAGWQWLFLLQGLPTVLLGIGLLFVFSDGPAKANWLTDAERAALARGLAADRDAGEPSVVAGLGEILRNPSVWALGLVYFSIQGGVYAINFWLPSILRTSGIADPVAIGWLSAVPYLAAALAMQGVGRSADRHDERRWHLAVPMIVGAAGLAVAAAFSGSAWLALLGLTLAAMGALTGLPMFWPLPARALGLSAMAAGLAFINSIGQLAGFLSPYAVGYVKDVTGRTDLALFGLALLMFLGAIHVLRMSMDGRSGATGARRE